MKNLISKASIYRAAFPSTALDLSMAFEDAAYEPPVGQNPTSFGFVKLNDEGYVVDIAGGFAFAMRIGDKLVPSSLLRAEVAKRVAEIEDDYGRKIGKKARREITDEVKGELTSRALCRENTVTAFYHTASQTLILNTTSQRVCDIAMTKLVRAVDTFKTTTIHVSVNSGLTTRLKDWLVVDEGEAAFGAFEPSGRIALASPDKRTLTIKTESLLSNSDALQEALRHGYQVKSMGLTSRHASFVLNDKFKFSQITYPVPEADGVDPDDQTWATQAFIEVSSLVEVVRDLCAMFGYEEPELG